MQDYLEIAQKLALEAGDIMLEHFVIGVDHETKSDNTPVTIADKAINKLVIDRINEAFPGHNILGEEQSDLHNETPFTWVCDPIDGTIPYTFGIPVNVFSLALVKDGQSIVAVVYDPYMKRLFHAVLGQGTFMNGERINVNNKSSLEYQRIGHSGPPSKFIDMPEVYVAMGKKNIRGLYLVCSIYESMLVATGQTVACVFPGETAHDAVTAKLIVEEAGGRVTDLFGKDQAYDKPIRGAVITNGKVHDELLLLLKPHLT